MAARTKRHLWRILNGADLSLSFTSALKKLHGKKSVSRLKSKDCRSAGRWRCLARLAARANVSDLENASHGTAASSLPNTRISSVCRRNVLAKRLCSEATDSTHSLKTLIAWHVKTDRSDAWTRLQLEWGTERGGVSEWVEFNVHSTQTGNFGDESFHLKLVYTCKCDDYSFHWLISNIQLHHSWVLYWTSWNTCLRRAGSDWQTDSLPDASVMVCDAWRRAAAAAAAQWRGVTTVELEQLCQVSSMHSTPLSRITSLAFYALHHCLPLIITLLISPVEYNYGMSEASGCKACSCLTWKCRTICKWRTSRTQNKENHSSWLFYS